MKSDFVKEMSLHDYCLYIAQCNEALPAEPFALEDDESAVTEALIGRAVHTPRPVVYSTRDE